MAELTIQNTSLGGIAPTFAAADAAGDSFENDGRTVIHVKNASAGAITATIDSAALCNHGFDHDISVSVPAGGERMIGPFPRVRFGSPAQVGYSAVASVSVAAVRVPGA
jgi:hypothetical protein